MCILTIIVVCAFVSSSHYEKRTGPGRKSNAEHAIAFYEYILNGEDEEEDEVEFLNVHNDECDVCDKGGELLCCSSCTLVFHLQCVRPKLKALPEGEWECPHCIMTSSKKSTKAYKEAVVAIEEMEKLKAADRPEDPGDNDEKVVDDKESIDPELTVDESADSNGKSKELQHAIAEPKEKIAEKMNTSSSEEDMEEYEDTNSLDGDGDDSKPRSKKMALYKISDSLSTAFKVDPLSPTGRGKRSRRQPLMYQPQSVPDSKWQSDEVHALLNAEDNNSDEEKGKSEIPEKRASVPKAGINVEDKPVRSTSITNEDNKQKNDTEIGEKHDEDDMACQFCQDDPKIPICVFCGCRSCFGKHSKDQLLICDQCENEYHMFCLKPALNSVPVRKWFCPACKNGASSEPKIATRRTSTSPTKSLTGTRGTEKKEKTPGMKQTTTSTKQATKSDVSPPKRPRGRPPKNKSPSTSASSPPPVKRPRGRPPKNPPTGSDSSPVKRPRGRPPKNKSPQQQIVPQAVRKKPGPKPGSKNKRTLLAEASEQPTKKPRIEESPPLPSEEPEPVKISRSGRVVKRSSFHDEMEEGEQHLRSSRRDEGEEDDSAVPTEEDNSRGDTVEDESIRGDDDSDDIDRPVRTKVINPPNSIPMAGPLKGEALEVGRLLPNSVAVSRIPEDSASTKTDTNTNQILHVDVGVASEPTPSATSATVTISRPPEESVNVDGAAASEKVPQVPIPSGDGTAVATSTSHQEKKTVVETAAQPLEPKTARAEGGPPYVLTVDVDELVKKAVANIPHDEPEEAPAPTNGPVKVPRRKPGARECMQISRRFGNRVIPKKYMDTLMDYCTRGKVEHLIRMRERLDEHTRYLESQLAGLEAQVREKGETSAIVPPLPEHIPLDTISGATPTSNNSYSPMGGPSVAKITPAPLLGGVGQVANKAGPTTTSARVSSTICPSGLTQQQARPIVIPASSRTGATAANKAPQVSRPIVIPARSSGIRTTQPVPSAPSK